MEEVIAIIVMVLFVFVAVTTFAVMMGNRWDESDKEVLKEPEEEPQGGDKNDWTTIHGPSRPQI